MNQVICIVPAAPVRKKASHKAEMVNQLLFGEIMRVIDIKKGWLLIQSVHDNYEGWIRNNLVAPVEQADESALLAGDLVNRIEMDQSSMFIPFGANLPGLYNNQGRIADKSYRFEGSVVNRNQEKPGEESIRKLSSLWLNAPYLWGGRTPLGVDCSGFAQIIFKMIGINLLRDARQQVGQGMKVKHLDQALCGDLAFFEKKDKITHVGIILTPQEIIHASGKVRIDKITKKGIFHSDSGKQTHSLASIRRYW